MTDTGIAPASNMTACPRIHLFSTFEPARIAWVPQFVDHYRTLGVASFHLSLHLDPNLPYVSTVDACNEAEATLRTAGVSLKAVLVCPFSAEALQSHHACFQRQDCSAEDWIVWSDIDEFQVYPADLPTMIRFAERNQIDYFWGEFVDRISATGALEPFDPRRSIWSQYPRTCYLTRDVAEAETHKVTCARATVLVSPGNHWVTNEQSLRYYANPVEVHHFKWDASVISRLGRRVLPEGRERWWMESQRLIDFLGQNPVVSANP